MCLDSAGEVDNETCRPADTTGYRRPFTKNQHTQIHTGVGVHARYAGHLSSFMIGNVGFTTITKYWASGPLADIRNIYDITDHILNSFSSAWAMVVE